MAISSAQFVQDWPAFADSTAYPPAMINFWINMAGQLINVCRWGASAVTPWPALPIAPPAVAPVLTLYDLGTELYVAHCMTLQAQENEEAANGAPPGLSKGPLASESVDKASASYNSQLSAEENGGWWNLTVYGTMFLRMLRQFGAGGMYIGIGYDPQPCLNGPAWPGPYPFPSPTGFSS